MNWESFVSAITSDYANAFYSKAGQIITVLSAVFAFWNSWSAKKALLADNQQRTRNGEVELSVTYPIGNNRFRLAKLATRATNALFLNRVRENHFRQSPNQSVEAEIHGSMEKVGLHDMGSTGENKFVSLTFATLIAEMTQQSTLWAAAGVPSRMVRFLHAFRHDSYATLNKADGYQTGRSMLFRLDDVIRAGEDPEFLKSETEIAYQRDRLYQMQEVYRIWKSNEESDKFRVVEIVVPIPEILFMGSEVEKLNGIVEQVQKTTTELRELGGELSNARLEELASNAARKALQGLAAALPTT